MHRALHLTLALCAAAVALTGCKAKESAQPAAAASVEPTILRVTTADFAFESPDSVAAGLTMIRLVNIGPSFHHIQLIRLDQGKTLADFLPTMQPDAKGGPPQWATWIGGPNAPAVGDSATTAVQLDPGSYALICLIPDASGAPHFTKGMARMLTVTAPASAAAEPAADLTMKLVDYDFQLSAPLTAGHHVIRVENAGQQLHEVLLVKLESGKTLANFADWAMKMTGPPPGSPQGGSTGIPPGSHDFFVVDLTPGEYGLICFFPDAKDGKPHFAHGMIKPVTVS